MTPFRPRMVAASLVAVSAFLWGGAATLFGPEGGSLFLHGWWPVVHVAVVALLVAAAVAPADGFWYTVAKGALSYTALLCLLMLGMLTVYALNIGGRTMRDVEVNFDDDPAAAFAQLFMLAIYGGSVVGSAVGVAAWAWRGISRRVGPGSS